MIRHLSAIVRALFTTARNLFRAPTTVRFPAEVRPRADRVRASFALTHDEAGEANCIGCLACAKICPSAVLTVIAAPKRTSPVTGKKRGYCADFTLDLQACIICELCVQVCPTDAIVMTRTTEVPGFEREDLFLTMERLYANETGKRVAWATATLLNEMQDPKRGLVAEVAAPTPEEA